MRDGDNRRAPSAGPVGVSCPVYAFWCAWKGTRSRTHGQEPSREMPCLCPLDEL